MKYLKRIFCLLLCVTLLAGCVLVGEVNIQIGGSGSGSFVYEEDAYHIGDIVAVYEGVRPDQRSFADAESEVAYTRITAVTPQGDGRAVYQYVGAEQEDVLFVPDVIPVHQECLLAAGTNSTAPQGHSALHFSSDDIFAEMRLDENTEVEPGDYLAFYTGSPEDGTVTAYAEVTEVIHTENEDGEDSADIQYKVVTIQENLRGKDSGQCI